MVYLIYMNVGNGAMTANLSEATTVTHSMFDELQSDKQIPQVVIKTDIEGLLNNRKRDIYQEGLFTYADKNGSEQQLEIRVKPRGKFRRRICDFPSVKVKFSKKELKKSRIHPFSSFKLVTHCLDDHEASKENILREYFAYKLYNELTDTSFRVQLLKITYEDAKGHIIPKTRYGFLIESKKELLQRINAISWKPSTVPSDSICHINTDKVALFQYMIGNEDWKVTPFHKNVELVKLKNRDVYQPIPYDFDFSGVVNAPYARMNTKHHKKSIRDRYFLGLRPDSEITKQEIQSHLGKKEQLLAFCDNFKLLPPKSRKDLRKYLSAYFKLIDKERLSGIQRY